MKILLLGDENFTFSSGFVASHLEDEIEIGCCLAEDQLKDDSRPMLDTLKEKGILIHFHVNPAQMKSSFGENSFDQVLYILPGIAFHGAPAFIETKSEMFRLRLHLFCFGFLKSVKAAIKTDGDVIFLWPNIDDDSVPFSHLEVDKLAKFCYVQRSKINDTDFESDYYQDWKPLIHNTTKTVFPEWFKSLRYYYFRMDEESKSEKLKQVRKKRKGPPSSPPAEDEKKDETSPDTSSEANPNEEDDKVEDFNILKIPPQIFNFDRNQLPHVNECFHFKLWGKNSQSFQISKLTLKYDPRISGWKGDGTLTKTIKDAHLRGRPTRALKGDTIRPGTPGAYPPMHGAPSAYFPHPMLGSPPPPPPSGISYGPYQGTSAGYGMHPHHPAMGPKVGFPPHGPPPNAASVAHRPPLHQPPSSVSQPPPQRPPPPLDAIYRPMCYPPAVSSPSPSAPQSSAHPLNHNQPPQTGLRPIPYQHHPTLPKSLNPPPNPPANSQQSSNTLSQTTPTTLTSRQPIPPQPGSTIGTARLVQIKRSSEPPSSVSSAKRPKATPSPPLPQTTEYTEDSTAYHSGQSPTRSTVTTYSSTSPYTYNTTSSTPHDYYATSGYSDGYTDGYSAYVQGGYDAYRGSTAYDKSSFDIPYNDRYATYDGYPPTDYGAVATPPYDSLHYSTGDYTGSNDYYGYTQGAYNHGYAIMNNMGYYDSIGAPRVTAENTASGYSYDYSAGQAYDSYKQDYTAHTTAHSGYEDYGYDNARTSSSATSQGYDSTYYADGIYTSQPGSSYTGTAYISSTGKSTSSAISNSHHSSPSFNQYGRY